MQKNYGFILVFKLRKVQFCIRKYKGTTKKNYNFILVCKFRYFFIYLKNIKITTSGAKIRINSNNLSYQNKVIFCFTPPNQSKIII